MMTAISEARALEADTPAGAGVMTPKDAAGTAILGDTVKRHVAGGTIATIAVPAAVDASATMSAECAPIGPATVAEIKAAIKAISAAIRVIRVVRDAADGSEIPKDMRKPRAADGKSAKAR